MGSVQPPSSGMQLPARWQTPLATQTTALPTQAPPLHWSPVVHRLPSSQAVESGSTVQVPVEHDWQSAGFPPPHAESQHTPSTQKPLAHPVVEVQASPSERPITMGTDFPATPLVTSHIRYGPGVAVAGMAA